MIYKIDLIAWTAISFLTATATATALECPPMPQQASKDTLIALNIAFLKLGPLKGVELAGQVKRETQDLLGKLPNADKVHLEQMMYSAACSTFRDNRFLSEAEREQRIKELNATVRAVLNPSPPQVSKANSATRPKIRPQQQPGMDALKLVALDIKDPDSEKPTLDLMLLNEGPRTAFLTAVVVEVVKSEPETVQFVPPSASYDLLIESKLNKLSVSQEVKPNDVDRFLVALGASSNYVSRSLTLRLRIEYNGNRTISSESFGVLIRGSKRDKSPTDAQPVAPPDAHAAALRLLLGRR